MDGAEWVMQYGVLGVAFMAFVGATLVPVSSEVVVVAALQLGMPAWQVLLSASAGNALGASFSYGIGRAFSERTRRKLGESRAGRRSLRWADEHGNWVLLGSWLPVVGDPICLAAGVFRMSPLAFVLLGIGTRVGRYVLLILVF